MTIITLEQVMQDWAESYQPYIKPKLFRGQARKWYVRIEEVLPESPSKGFVPYHFTSRRLDDQIDWSVKTLETWKTAHRTSWDTWRFNSKRDAEKFITVYNLIWS